MLQESCAEAIIVWRNSFESEPFRAALQRSSVTVLYVEDLIVYSNSGASDSFLKSAQDHLHFSKACWISMSGGDGFEEAVGHVTEVKTQCASPLTSLLP